MYPAFLSTSARHTNHCIQSFRAARVAYPSARVGPSATTSCHILQLVGRRIRRDANCPENALRLEALYESPPQRSSPSRRPSFRQRSAETIFAERRTRAQYARTQHHESWIQPKPVRTSACAFARAMRLADDAVLATSQTYPSFMFHAETVLCCSVWRWWTGSWMQVLLTGWCIARRTLLGH